MKTHCCPLSCSIAAWRFIEKEQSCGHETLFLRSDIPLWILLYGNLKLFRPN
jgi:hypothetical protein